MNTPATAAEKLDKAKQLIGLAILHYQTKTGEYDEDLTEAHALIVGAEAMREVATAQSEQSDLTAEVKAFQVGDIVRIKINNENFCETSIEVRIRMVATEEGQYHTYRPDWIGCRVWASGLDRTVGITDCDYFCEKHGGGFQVLLADVDEAMLFPCEVELVRRSVL
jgi:transcription elongation factor